MKSDQFRQQQHQTCVSLHLVWLSSPLHRNAESVSTLKTNTSALTQTFRENNFDLIRLFAAGQVAISHTFGHLGIEIPGSLWFLGFFPGVPIFFVISGFLVSASFERRSSLRSYFANRGLRIYPALWVCLAVTCATLFIFYRPESAPSLKSLAAWIGAQLTIAQFYTADFLRSYGLGTPNGSLWTIPVELQFYLLLPVIVFGVGRMKWNPVIMVLIFVCLAIFNQYYAMLVGERPENLVLKLLGVSLLPYLYLFLLGIILNAYRAQMLVFLAGKAGLWLALFTLATAILSQFGLEVSGNLLNPVSATLLGILTVSAAYTLPSTANALLKGQDISYGVYIYHVVFLNVAIHLEMKGSGIALVAVLSTTVVFALASWHFIEKPALRLKRHFV